METLISNKTMQILMTVATIVAIYLSFKRNKGFDLGSFLVALIFAPVYIVYYLATTKETLFEMV